ncbi:prickle-like protein 4 [Bombina bombina]|uniref:prickle-like protein 4 n=1 Tax=Bombina bombina TaxID=8345 RepID=UPI00235A692F|nr:prickle-like protein 4 [Bombina bombina]XP_053562722.1 prickle-like protein 4 [Bombina bombina]
MAPESAVPPRGVRSSSALTSSSSSSDSDSGCALEEYPDLEVRPSNADISFPDATLRELKFVRMLLQILPPQDCDEQFCTALGEQEKRELQRFSAYRRLHCMRRGIPAPVTQENSNSFCMGCGDRFETGDIAVRAERTQDDGLSWHLSCFVCDTCHLPLSQFIYFLQDGRIYCGRHHAELSRARCAACDQLILSDECIIAEGHRWHVDHFRCWECDGVLGGSQYIMKGGRPFCSGCFLCLYAESCEACGEPVNPDGDLVTFIGQYWHMSPSCFHCIICRIPLQKAKFTVHDGNLYCHQCCSTLDTKEHNHSSIQRIPMGTIARIPSQQYNSRRICEHYNHPDVPRDRAAFICTLQDSACITSQEGKTELCRSASCDASVSRLHEYREEMVKEEEEETSCSSTDSEPEGFFLGTPIPNYPISRDIPSPVPGRNSSLKSRRRRKSCRVS